jgi:hypothetical protein
MPNPIAIICSLQELYDYATDAIPATGTTPAVPATRMFALNISTAVDTTQSGALSADEINLLSPWTWTITGVQLWPYSATTNGPAIPGTFCTQPAPATSAAVANLTTRLATQLSAATTEVVWNPIDPGAGHADGANSWPHMLAHASTYPAPLPYALNVVVFFTVPASALASSTNFFAAPIFKIGAYSYTLDTKTGPVTKGSATAFGQTYSWPYTLPYVNCYQPAYTNVAAPVLGSLDFGNMWIKVAEQVANEDWHTTLEQRAASAFDLGQLVIDSLRVYILSADNPTPPPAPDPSQYELLRSIVVSILHDTADSGLRYSPDGANLLRFVLGRVSGPTFTEDWLVDAEKALTRFDQKLTPDAWNTQLSDIFKGVPTPQALSPITSNNSPSFATLVGWLDELQAKLAASSMVAQIVFDTWNTCFMASATVAASWTSQVSAAVQAELTALSAQSQTLRQRMLQANLGGRDTSLQTWTALTKPVAGSTTATTLAQVRLNLAGLLKDYFNCRLGSATTNPEFTARAPLLGANASKPTLPAPIVASLTAALGKNADTLSANVYLGEVSFTNPKPAADGSRQPNTSLTHTPHPVIVQVHDAVDAASEKLVRSIAGVAVLMLETGSANWSCLQIASVSVLDANGSNAALAQLVGFVPQRLSERNALLQGSVSYNNQPLIAPSPAAIMGQDIQKNSPLPADPEDQAQLLSYAPLPVSPTTQPTDLSFWARIPGLKFGKQYQFLAFAIRNSGALPRHLVANPMVPWLPEPSSTFTLPFAPIPHSIQPAFSPVPITIDYKRRVPVGHVRYSGVTGNVVTFSQESLPSIPDSVEPLARRLYDAFIQASAPVPKPADPKPAPLPVPKTPLLLLWNSSSATNAATSGYSFKVRPPATDFQTWDRWIASTPDPTSAGGGTELSLRTTRKAVFADFSWNAPKGIPTDNADTYAALRDPSIKLLDTTINDPAIKGFILTLTHISSNPGTPIAKQFISIDQPAPLPLATAFNSGDGFKQVQTGEIQVDVSMGDATLIPGAAPRTFTVKVPAGQVWQLSIAPAVLASQPETDKLELFMTAEGGQFAAASQTFDGASYIPVADPLLMLVESAQTASLTSESLWRALHIGEDEDKGAVTVTLDPAKATADWNLVRRVEVLQQSWRWMGRPYWDASFPTAASTDIDMVTGATPGSTGNAPSPLMVNALTWEMEAFADRENDLIVSEARPDFGAEAPLPSNPPEIFRTAIPNDLRAHYFRFGARAYSRYEGLPGFTPFANTSASFVPAAISLVTSGAPDGMTPWKRFFWPSQFFDPATTPPVIPTSLPKPQVLLCIPLTLPQPAKPPQVAPAPSSSLLVILEEPWFEVGGLAEELHIVIDSASTVIDLNGQGLITLPEIGPDPLLPISSAPDLQKFKSPLVEAKAGSPMGTTFDEASAAPLFANTCFQFDLTDLAGVLGVKSLDWYMAKVQFKRTLRLDRIANGNQQNLPLESALTESSWVQFLPSSDHFTAQGTLAPTHIDNISFSTPDAVTVTLSPALQAGPVSMPVSPARPVFELWSLLMRDITDATGHTSEVFVALSRDVDGKIQTVDTAGSSLISAATHLYLLEVQKTLKAVNPPTQSWINDLFPTGDLTHDATYRVVRISGKIKRK